MMLTTTYIRGLRVLGPVKQIELALVGFETNIETGVGDRPSSSEGVKLFPKNLVRIRFRDAGNHIQNQPASI